MKNLPNTMSKSVFVVLAFVLLIILLLSDMAVGVLALVNYAKGVNVSDSGSSIGASCVAQPSETSQYTAHRISGGAVIEPSSQLVIAQFMLLVVVIVVSLGLFKYRGWRYKVLAMGGLAIVLAIEIILFSGFHSAINMLCNG